MPTVGGRYFREIHKIRIRGVYTYDSKITNRILFVSHFDIGKHSFNSYLCSNFFFFKVNMSAQVKMYESIFQYQTSKEDFKSFPLTTVNGTFRPLNPPPFSLATVNKRSSFIGKPVKKSAGTFTKDTPYCSHVYTNNTFIMSSEETEIVALLASLKNSDSKIR